MNEFKREDCWLTFTEALDQYLVAREVVRSAPEGCKRHQSASEELEIAKKHLEAYTSVQ